MKTETKSFEEKLAEIQAGLSAVEGQLARIGEALENRSLAQANAEGLLSAKQVLAKIFSDNESRPNDRWLRRLAQNGEVPSVRMGGSVFFKLSEVVAALNGDGKPTDEDFERMPLNELWQHYEGLPHTNAKSEFYRKHISPREAHFRP